MNQSTHSSVAYSTMSMLRQGPRRELHPRPDVTADASLRLVGPVWLYGSATAVQAQPSKAPELAFGLRLLEEF